MKNHTYHATVTWTGNQGAGTLDYKSYGRQHEITAVGKPAIPCSSDPVFRGDASRYNPEDLLVGSLSGCHMLWYLHLCAVNHVTVVSYHDQAEGTMIEHPDGSGEFTEVVLRPEVHVATKEMVARAEQLHHEAHRLCFIARSVNFQVKHEPVTRVAL